MNDDSPPAIRAVLDELGIRPRKRWGQNYLINRGVREKLVVLLDVGPGMTVWEIGPGLGAMTWLLVEALDGAELTVFEIDRKVIGYLERRFAGRPLRIVSGDAVRTWHEEAAGAGLPDRLLGNLPYSCASAIIGSFVEADIFPARAVFTVQKELAERLVSEPGRKTYSAFSIICRQSLAIESHGDVRPGSFYPAPEVTSTIVSVRRRTTGPTAVDPALFRSLVRRLFASRRKTLRNNILAGESDLEPLLAACAECGIDTTRRPEEIDVETYVRLANRVATVSRAPGARPPAP